MTDPIQHEAEVAPPPSIQIVLGAEIDILPDAPHTVELVTKMLSPPSAGSGLGSGASIWMLDRSNPQLWQPQPFECNDRVTVPDGVAPLLDANHVLVALFVGNSAQLPQGALFDFLMANGAGNALATMERVSSNQGSGIGGYFAYALVAVPAIGPAMEFLQFPVAAVDLRLGAPGTNELWLAAYFPFELNLADDGKYVPERSLDPPGT